MLDTYCPSGIVQEDLSSAIESFSDLSKDSYLAHCGEFSEQSKVEELLGGGKVADILLWRDERSSFIYFLHSVSVVLLVFPLWKNFYLIYSQASIAVASFLFGYGVLPSNIFGFNLPNIPLSALEMSETLTNDSIVRIAFLWNWVFRNIRSLAKGGDWNNFFKLWFWRSQHSLYMSNVNQKSME